MPSNLGVSAEVRFPLGWRVGPGGILLEPDEYERAMISAARQPVAAGGRSRIERGGLHLPRGNPLSHVQVRRMLCNPTPK
jgi:hypothetical protein